MPPSVCEPPKSVGVLLDSPLEGVGDDGVVETGRAGLGGAAGRLAFDGGCGLGFDGGWGAFGCGDGFAFAGAGLGDGFGWGFGWSFGWGFGEAAFLAGFGFDAVFGRAATTFFTALAGFATAFF